jgi:hypothetical protein
MAWGKKKGAANAAKGGEQEVGLRPILLAGGLGLLWFAAFPQDVFEGDLPAWSVAAQFGSRLFADFVGGWVAVSLLRLAFASQRYAVSRARAGVFEAVT